MPKVFNTTALCVPEKHYMVDLTKRMGEIKKLVDEGKYFTINKARQYGKTTTLFALEQFLQPYDYVVSIDFQTFDEEVFENGKLFSRAFAESFLEELKRNAPDICDAMEQACANLAQCVQTPDTSFTLKALFEKLGNICAAAEKPVVLLIDEVDSASNNQVFLDFLAQIRAQYIRRFHRAAFQSVILAGVYDVKNLKLKIRDADAHRYNSPWNIAADFKVDMSFSEDDIAGMLNEYEADWKTGMDVRQMAQVLYAYTSGYPFLVSRLCQLMDEEVSAKDAYASKAEVWTMQGFQDAVRMLLTEKNTLFESLINKLHDYPQLNTMLKTLLFTGQGISYNADEPAMDMATMFGFIKNQNGMVVVANRIFETRLYNYYLSSAEMQNSDLYKASLQDKSQFLVDGYLDMRKILEKFVVHFHEIYGECRENFLEEEGRRYFLLYLRPIINGTGNYYIESRTRDLRRTDIIVDYRGKQYIIEMKIWHGREYQERGEKQLVGYLKDYHVEQGYMVSFNFNQKKEIGVHEVLVEGKKIIEAVV